ncbi:MAG: hypothetical protein ACJ72A_08535 [Nocardioidaceae bacterium]
MRATVAPPPVLLASNTVLAGIAKHVVNRVHGNFRIAWAPRLTLGSPRVGATWAPRGGRENPR